MLSKVVAGIFSWAWVPHDPLGMQAAVAPTELSGMSGNDRPHSLADPETVIVPEATAALTSCQSSICPLPELVTVFDGQPTGSLMWAPKRAPLMAVQPASLPLEPLELLALLVEPPPEELDVPPELVLPEL